MSKGYFRRYENGMKASGTYTDMEGTTNPVGGVQMGQTFLNVPVEDVIYTMLHNENPPRITGTGSCTDLNGATVNTGQCVEVGNVLSNGKWTWTTRKGTKTLMQFSWSDYQGTVIDDLVPVGGNGATYNYDTTGVTYTSTVDYHMSFPGFVYDGKYKVFDRPTFYFKQPYYWGVTTLTLADWEVMSQNNQIDWINYLQPNGFKKEMVIDQPAQVAKDFTTNQERIVFLCPPSWTPFPSIFNNYNQEVLTTFRTAKVWVTGEFGVKLEYTAFISVNATKGSYTNYFKKSK